MYDVVFGGVVLNPDHVLTRVRVVLVSPSHPANVGSCARAMKTMGLRDLVLVNPRVGGVLQDEQAVALASGATDVLAQARICQSLKQALSDVNYALASSSRARELAPDVLDAQIGAQTAVEFLQCHSEAKVALVLGCERAGLSNEDILTCSAQVMIPADPVYASLNIAQALQLLAYEVRKAVLCAFSMNAFSDVGQNSNTSVVHADVERLFERFVQAMQAVDYLNLQRPKRLVPRLQRLLHKARLEREEIDLLHGFLNDVMRVSQGRWYRSEWDGLQVAIAQARQKYDEIESQ
jgi:tRNA/rRNA methyltransferase